MPSFPGEAGLGRGCRKPGSWTPTAFTAGCLHGANPTRPVPGQGLSKSIWPSQASHQCPKPRKAPAQLADKRKGVLPSAALGRPWFPRAGGSAGFVWTWRGSCELTPQGPVFSCRLTDTGGVPVGFRPLSSSPLQGPPPLFGGWAGGSPPAACPEHFPTSQPEPTAKGPGSDGIFVSPNARPLSGTLRRHTGWIPERSGLLGGVPGLSWSSGWKGFFFFFFAIPRGIRMLAPLPGTELEPLQWKEESSALDPREVPAEGLVTRAWLSTFPPRSASPSLAPSPGEPGCELVRSPVLGRLVPRPTPGPAWQ